MLRSFSVKNCKNFKEKVCLDLVHPGGYKFNENCVQNGILTKGLIYGKNGTGKTNFGKALMDIQSLVTGSSSISQQDYWQNVSVDEKFTEFSYSFELDHKNIDYMYTRDENGRLVKEKMVIDDILQFDVNYIYGDIQVDSDAALFSGVKLDNYLEQLNAVSVAGNNQNFSKLKDNPFMQVSMLTYLSGSFVWNENSLLAKLLKFIRRMSMIRVSESQTGTVCQNYIKRNGDKNLVAELQSFLTAMELPCQLESGELPDHSYELYFRDGDLFPFFGNASSGAYALTDLFLKVNNHRNSSFIYIDGFDAFYHYEMSRNVISYLRDKFPEVQIIFTTHNTDLMSNRLIRPDCLFILSAKGQITPVSRATQRELREGHNLQKMYVSGEFEDFE